MYECELRYRSDDDTIPKGGAIEQYQDLFHEAGKIVKLKDVTDKDLMRYLLDAGFVDVRVVLKKLPIGPWPKDQGKKVRRCRSLESWELLNIAASLTHVF